jgi:predicted secreted protein
VRVSVEQRGSAAYLHVVDNGIGMSKQLIETAFDLFVQGDRTLDRAEGGWASASRSVKRIVAMPRRHGAGEQRRPRPRHRVHRVAAVRAPQPAHAAASGFGDRGPAAPGARCWWSTTTSMR